VVNDLENREFENDARRFMAGGQWLHFWLAVAGIAAHFDENERCRKKPTPLAAFRKDVQQI